jgi:hypothetical protein
VKRKRGVVIERSEKEEGNNGISGKVCSKELSKGKGELNKVERMEWIGREDTKGIKKGNL